MDNSYKISVEGIELIITNPCERLRMAGPWTGDVYIGETLMSKDCLLDNFLLQPGGNNLFFAKYHSIDQYHYFTINFFNLANQSVFEFSREFDMLFLKTFVSENEIHVYESFNESSGNNFYFKLDDEEFYQV